MKSFMTGLAGPSLTTGEKAFLRAEQPAGLILFARNVETPDQVKALVSDALDAIGDGTRMVLVDQEGGRVRRLKPPHWPAYPAAAVIGQIDDQNPDDGARAAYLVARLIAHDLLQIGVTVDCLPCLDCRIGGATDAIGDRAYSSNPETVARLGAAAANGLRDGGVLPVIKHMPGHGRALVDSHYHLPTVTDTSEVLRDHDFRPFKDLNTLPIGMTAHIVFTAYDAERPATQSTRVINDVVRGELGFEGLLLSDDISMNALAGDVGERSRRALAAGCDVVLHCNGKMPEMQMAADAAHQMSEAALERYHRALKSRQPAVSIDISAARSEFEALAAPFWTPAS